MTGITGGIRCGRRRRIRAAVFAVHGHFFMLYCLLRGVVLAEGHGKRRHRLQGKPQGGQYEQQVDKAGTHHEEIIGRDMVERQSPDSQDSNKTG